MSPHSLFIAISILILSCFAISTANAAKSKLNQDYKCGVCSVFVNLIEDSVASAAIAHPYDVQSRYRLDEKKTTPYSRSETFIYSTFEDDKLKSKITSHGILRSEAPIRVVQKSFDVRVVADKNVEKDIALIYENVLEYHEEELVNIIRKSTVRETSLKNFCVDVYKACTEWPVTWNEPTDPMPEPEPVVEPEVVTEESKSEETKTEEVKSEEPTSSEGGDVANPIATENKDEL